MSFNPIQKLMVSRTLSTGDSVPVGTLAQNRRWVFFQYDANYLTAFGNLSPFALDAGTALQAAPKKPHSGLNGVFATTFLAVNPSTEKQRSDCVASDQTF